MGYLRPSGRFAIFTRGGRRYIVKPPTVSTVLSILQNCPQEIAALVKAYQKDAAVADPLARISTLTTLVRSAGSRMLPVLETFVSVEGGAVWALRDTFREDPMLAVPLLMAAAEMIDVAAAYRDTGLYKLNAETLEGLSVQEDSILDSELDPLERVILRVAWKFGQSPDAVMEWRWETFIAASKGFPLLRDDLPSSALTETADEIPFYTPGPMDAALGFGYTDQREQ